MKTEWQGEPIYFSSGFILPNLSSMSNLLLLDSKLIKVVSIYFFLSNVENRFVNSPLEKIIDVCAELFLEMKENCFHFQYPEIVSRQSVIG